MVKNVAEFTKTSWQIESIKPEVNYVLPVEDDDEVKMLVSDSMIASSCAEVVCPQASSRQIPKKQSNSKKGKKEGSAAFRSYINH